MTITFYDIPSTVPGNAWSPNTWKIRYALNYKGIPYKTEWVEFPDIEAVSKKLGVEPTTVFKDGRPPRYTLPAIHDPSTGAIIANTMDIIDYLEKTYPDRPTLFPHNTKGLQMAFREAYNTTGDALFQFIIPVVAEKLNPASQEYFYRTREVSFGKKLQEVYPKGEERNTEWAKVKEDYGKIDQWFAKNGGKGPFLMGETLSFGDITVAGYLIWMKMIWGEDSQDWKDVASWHGGRWKNLIDAFDKYSKVD